MLKLVLVQGLEDAKGALESETTSDRDLRIKQGEAKAYLSAHNMIVDLARLDASEDGDGKEPD